MTFDEMMNLGLAEKKMMQDYLLAFEFEFTVTKSEVIKAEYRKSMTGKTFLVTAENVIGKTIVSVCINNEPVFGVGVGYDTLSATYDCLKKYIGYIK